MSAPQKHLDSVLPKGPHLDGILVPAVDRRTQIRTQRRILFLPPHEAFASEALELNGFSNPEHMELPESYHSNKLVIDAKERGDSLPTPLIMFADGVRYTSTQAGRSDSILGIWFRSFETGKRHLVVAIRLQFLCRCGCRGWCTLHPIWCAIAWSLRFMSQGIRPTCMFDGRDRQRSDPYSPETAGLLLGYTAMLLFITGRVGSTISEPSPTICAPERRLAHVGVCVLCPNPPADSPRGGYCVYVSVCVPDP